MKWIVLSVGLAAAALVTLHFAFRALDAEDALGQGWEDEC